MGNMKAYRAAYGEPPDTFGLGVSGGDPVMIAENSSYKWLIHHVIGHLTPGTAYKQFHLAGTETGNVATEPRFGRMAIPHEHTSVQTRYPTPILVKGAMADALTGAETASVTMIATRVSVGQAGQQVNYMNAVEEVMTALNDGPDMLPAEDGYIFAVHNIDIYAQAGAAIYVFQIRVGSTDSSPTLFRTNIELPATHGTSNFHFDPPILVPALYAEKVAGNGQVTSVVLAERIKLGG